MMEDPSASVIHSHYYLSTHLLPVFKRDLFLNSSFTDTLDKFQMFY